MQALLSEEFLAVCRQWGEAQRRCSASLAEQAEQIRALTADVVRLRGALIVRDTRLAWLREELDGTAGRATALVAASDLVICQAGCISHDQYWRVQDHCRRTGKLCVLVDQPLALLQAQAWAALAPGPMQQPAGGAGGCAAALMADGTKNLEQKRPSPQDS